MGDFITDVSNGKKPVIKNSPVIPLKAEDFREIRIWLRVERINLMELVI